MYWYKYNNAANGTYDKPVPKKKIHIVIYKYGYLTKHMIA